MRFKMVIDICGSRVSVDTGLTTFVIGLDGHQVSPIPDTPIITDYYPTLDKVNRSTPTVPRARQRSCHLSEQHEATTIKTIKLPISYQVHHTQGTSTSFRQINRLNHCYANTPTSVNRFN